jgi:hypothetical protein
MDERKKDALDEDHLKDVSGGLDYSSVSQSIDIAGQPNRNSGTSPAEALGNIFNQLGASMGQGMQNASDNQQNIINSSLLSTGISAKDRTGGFL